MKEIKRDYIGSADAYRVFKKSYESLAKSKMKDSNIRSAKMQRGVLMEGDILDEFEKRTGQKVPDRQWRCSHPVLTYCKSTLDGLSAGKVVEEVKTSIHPCPEDSAALKEEYPQYWYQVQWQMWTSGLKRANVIWCQVPEDENEDPYKSGLELLVIRMKPDKKTFEVFEKNAPEFWSYWEGYKNDYTEPVQVVPDSAKKLFGKLVEEQKSVDNLHKEIERRSIDIINQLHEKEAEIVKTKEAIKDAMKENNILSYENDELKISYIQPYTKYSVDSDKLREDGIYDKYKKESHVGASIRIKIKEEK